MATRSLQSDSNPRRKRSFTLPSFRKTTAEHKSLATSSSDEAARIRKAAAWQWYTRGVGEVVLLTKSRPATAAGSAAAAATVLAPSAMGLVNSVKSDGREDRTEKKPPESRFKAEAAARGRPPAGGAVPPTTPASSIAAPSPLYDEVELSGLKTQMADFVQRMQLKQQSAVKPPAPAQASALHQPPLRPPPPDAEAEPGIRKSSSSSSAEVSDCRRPIFALHRFFRRVVSRSFYKGNSVAATTQEPDASPAINALEPEADDVQHHYHHYIHHHHHHYHYGDHPSPEDAEFNATPRCRRHSESSGLRPRIPALIWEENEDMDDRDDAGEESPLSAFLARRRRHSDSTFAEFVRRCSTSWKPDAGKVKRTPDEFRPAKRSPELLQVLRKYNSERFTNGNKIAEEWKDDVLVGEREGRWQIRADVKSRRRLSGESLREGAAMEGGGYKLSSYHERRPAVGGRHSESYVDAPRRRAEEVVHEGGGYKLSSYHERRPAVGRRHSESYVDAPRRRAEEVVHEELLRYEYLSAERDEGLKGRSLPSPASMSKVRQAPPHSAASRHHRQPTSRPPVYSLSYQP